MDRRPRARFSGRSWTIADCSRYSKTPVARKRPCSRSSRRHGRRALSQRKVVRLPGFGRLEFPLYFGGKGDAAGQGGKAKPGHADESKDPCSCSSRILHGQNCNGAGARFLRFFVEPERGFSSTPLDQIKKPPFGWPFITAHDLSHVPGYPAFMEPVIYEEHHLEGYTQRLEGLC